LLFASSEISSGVEPTIASDAWISVHFAPWRAERHCDEYDVPSPAKKGIISINYFIHCAPKYISMWTIRKYIFEHATFEQPFYL